MEREVLERIPKLQGLHTALKAAGVADLVWGVLGGIPASYLLLNSAWKSAGCPLGSTGDVAKMAKMVEAFLELKLARTAIAFNQVKASHRDLIGPVYDQFKTVDELPASILELHELPIHDKVLRLVADKGWKEGVLVPTSPAMALVMRYGVKGDPPSLEVVRKALGAKVS
jgi:hypothetical protein